VKNSRKLTAKNGCKNVISLIRLTVTVVQPVTLDFKTLLFYFFHSWVQILLHLCICKPQWLARFMCFVLSTKTIVTTLHSTLVVEHKQYLKG